MSLSAPIFLLAVLPAAAVLALGWRSARAGGAGRLAMGLRAAAALCLGLAAAGLALRFGGRPRALVILDRSASLAPAREAAADAARRSVRALSGRFEVSCASFAADARIEAEGALASLPPDESGTDPWAALALAAARLGPGEPAVIVTDGQWSLRSGGAANPQPAARGPQPSLVFLPVGPAGPDAALVELDAPSEVRPGEKFAVVARVAGTAAGPVTVRLTGPAGREAQAQTVSLPATGRAVRSAAFEETAPAAGLVEYRAELSAPGDAFAGNNSARALVRVAGKLRVAVIGPSQAISAALRDAGTDAIPLKLKPGESFEPENFDAAVVNNLPRRGRAEEAQGGEIDIATSDYQSVNDRLAAQLAGFVRAGGGLVVLGGPEAYGACGWEDSGALEKELPASMRPPGQELFVVLVLDRSGSMGRPAAAGSAESKLSLVKRAAQDVLGAFGATDRLAVVAFSEKAEVIAPVGRPADEATANRIRKAIADLAPGTSTHLADALAEAEKLLPPPEAGNARLVRHVLLLSDGLPEGVADRAAEVKRLEALARALAAAGATVSTVGTGGTDQDRELLRKIAEDWGRGRAYQPTDLAALESVFRGDLTRLGELVAKGNFRPEPADDPLAGALGALPEMAGRNRVSAKPRARVVLEVPPAAGRGREPLLVVWDRGRGRAACFASEFGGEWGGALAPDFLKALVNWAAGRSGERGARLALVREPRGGWRLELVARDGAGRPLENLAPAAEVADLAGSFSAKIELLQESPARYAARLVPPPDAKEIIATARDGKTGRELARGAFPLPFPEELARIGVDRAAVEELAGLTGGRVIAAPGELARMDFPRAASRGVAQAAPWLALAGLLLVLAELALRVARRTG